MENIQIGESDMVVTRMGVGAMAWSNSSQWGYGAKLGRRDIQKAFDVAAARSPVLFDTAEIYGFGKSERILGQMLHKAPNGVYTATKFAPLPWRLSGRAVSRAINGSLRRLGQTRIDLYQTHFPGGWVDIPALMNKLADAVGEGKIRYIGVSNYDAHQMRIAYEVLSKRGLPLVSNQVEYSLIHRSPDDEGVLKTCQELNVTLIAYSPLGRGVLSGKYAPGHGARDIRRFYGQFRKNRLWEVAPLITALKEIGEAHGGKSAAQVALNWLVRQPNILPIPGVKNERQAGDNMDAITWAMGDDEAEKLNQISWTIRR
jgi:aryl-alcohol dehydrogenase-like predicted oxidoreductase